MRSFTIPMSSVVLYIYFGIVAVGVAAATWCFRSGILWSAICILAVILPLALVYWYMLYLNPARSSVKVHKAGIHIKTPPFLDAAIPFSTIKQAFVTNTKTDERFALDKKPVRGMCFGPYRTGTFKLLSDGREVLAATRSHTSLVIETDERFYLIGPSSFNEFLESVQKYITVKQ